MNTSFKSRFFIVFSLLAASCFTKAYGQHIWPKDADNYTHPVPGEKAMGRWDITINTPNGHAASWLEIAKSGNGALVGQFVGRGGSARPVSEIKYDSKAKQYHFTIPPQWGAHKTHLEFKLKDGRLVGQVGPPNGKKHHFTADRAPTLKRTGSVKWGSPIDLLQNGMSGWKAPGDGGWSFKDGILIHQGHGSNIMTKQTFNDFKLHVEFRYKKGSNSGIYLRGRYEVQVLDSYGMHTGSHMLGGVYGFLTPTMNMAKKPGQWQTYDITIRGRMVTIELNGKKIICNRPIPGITGGAINSHEGQPGPIMLQGSENGRIEYRNMVITPAQKDAKDPGFTSLFNGKDLSGWVGATNDYTVRDGVIECRPGAKGNLYTKKQYSNFVFRFEFKLTPEANNGLAIRAPLKGNPAYKAMEIQILDNTGKRFNDKSADNYYKLHNYQYHGSIYGVVPAKQGYLNPVGEWNREQVTANGSHITVRLNGQVITDADLDSVEPIDGRKHPGLHRKSGHIGFLGHNAKVFFRNIRIKELGG